MSTKHVFDSADGLVAKSLRGAVMLNPSIRLHAGSKSVYVSSPSKTTRVAVISGGGAGHEPAHASYTGRGMLAASVSGDIFASPSAKQILDTIKFAAFGGSDPSPTKDVLVIINNYTGDRLNFGLAIEQARAVLPTIRLESVVVADDASLLRSTSDASLVGPRGLAGNILVCKLLGALAERGETLDCIKAFGDAVVENLESIGVGLEHCRVPGRAPEQGNATLKLDECEVGLGLHNEPGVMKKQLQGSQQLVATMLSLILSSKDDDVLGNKTTGSTFLSTSPTGERDDVVLFVNNLGGMSQLEMGALLDEIVNQLATISVHPLRVYLSSYMTSLNAPGFSISILNISGVQRMLQESGAGRVDVLGLLDDPTDALAWIGVRSHWPTQRPRDLVQEQKETELFLESIRAVDDIVNPEVRDLDWWKSADVSPTAIENGIKSACNAILQVHKDLTMFDTVVGDGDCGETFSAGARAILDATSSGKLKVAEVNPAALVKKIAEIIEDCMGGTIGALFGIFLTAMSGSLHNVSSISWPAAIKEGLSALSKHTPAKPGDRTIIDALTPFSAALSAGSNIDEAAKAAREGANSTKGMKAKLGRAVYVNSQSDSEVPPDPGAWGVAAIVEGFCEGYRYGGKAQGQ